MRGPEYVLTAAFTLIKITVNVVTVLTYVAAPAAVFAHSDREMDSNW